MILAPFLTPLRLYISSNLVAGINLNSGTGSYLDNLGEKYCGTPPKISTYIQFIFNNFAFCPACVFLIYVEKSCSW